MKLAVRSSIYLSLLTISFSLLSVLLINWNPERTSFLGIFFSIISTLPAIFSYATWGYFFVYPVIKNRKPDSKTITRPTAHNLTSLLITYLTTFISWTSIYMIFWFQYDTAWKDIDHSVSSPYLAWLGLLTTSTYLGVGTAPIYGIPNNTIAACFTALQIVATWVNVLFIIVYSITLWDNRKLASSAKINTKIHSSGMRIINK
jgi:hypothetical protein